MKICQDICPQKLSVSRSEQFSESVAGGKDITGITVKGSKSKGYNGIRRNLTNDNTFQQFYSTK